MPRGREPSFELKTIIWDVAATVGKGKTEAIRRQVDCELEKRRKDAEFFEDTPDNRTIRRIIDKDINKLSQDAVLAKLPPHIWRLRDDYESLKRVEEDGQTKEVPKEDTAEAIRQHDAKIFKESDAIMNEDDLYEFLFGLEEDASYLRSQGRKVSLFLHFFGWVGETAGRKRESKKYLDPNLQRALDAACSSLKTLDCFIGVHFFVVSAEDDWRLRFHPDPPFRDSADWRKLLKELDRLTDDCKEPYSSYRALIRETLYL